MVEEEEKSMAPKANGEARRRPIRKWNSNIEKQTNRCVSHQSISGRRNEMGKRRGWWKSRCV